MEENFKDGELISEKCWDENGNEKECYFEYKITYN